MTVLLSWGWSDHFGGQGDDLHVVLVAQLAGDGPEDAGALGVAVVLDQHHRVAVELHVAAVSATRGLGGPDNHGLALVAGLHVGAGEGTLDGDEDAVAHAGRPARELARPRRAPVHADHVGDLRPAVVRDFTPGFLLQHGSTLLLHSATS